MQPGLVSPVSCSPQPARSCTQHPGISSEFGCDSENWNFHKQCPMRQPPSPGQGHQGQGSEPPIGEGVRETILLAFCISLCVPECPSPVCMLLAKHTFVFCSRFLHKQYIPQDQNSKDTKSRRLSVPPTHVHQLAYYSPWK